MKAQSLQIHATLGKPQVTNLHDFNHRILQDLAMTSAPGLGALNFPGKPRLQQSKAGGQDPTLLAVLGQPSVELGVLELPMPRSHLSRVRYRSRRHLVQHRG